MWLHDARFYGAVAWAPLPPEYSISSLCTLCPVEVRLSIPLRPRSIWLRDTVWVSHLLHDLLYVEHENLFQWWSWSKSDQTSSTVSAQNFLVTHYQMNQNLSSSQRCTMLIYCTEEKFPCASLCPPLLAISLYTNTAKGWSFSRYKKKLIILELIAS